MPNYKQIQCKIHTVMDTPINDKLSGKQTENVGTHCRDSLDAHVCLVHKTIMQHCIGTTTDHADEQVRNHAVLHIHNYTLWNGQQQLLTDKYTSKSYINKCMKSSGKISPKTEEKNVKYMGNKAAYLAEKVAHQSENPAVRLSQHT